MRWKMQRHAEVYFLPAFPKKVLQPICLVEPASKHLHRACKMTQAAWVPAEFAHIDPQLVQVLKSHQNKSVNTTFVHFCAWFSGISIMCVLSFVWLNLFSQSVSQSVSRQSALQSKRHSLSLFLGKKIGPSFSKPASPFERQEPNTVRYMLHPPSIAQGPRSCFPGP